MVMVRRTPDLYYIILVTPAGALRFWRSDVPSETGWTPNRSKASSFVAERLETQLRLAREMASHSRKTYGSNPEIFSMRRSTYNAIHRHARTKDSVPLTDLGDRE